MSDCLFCRIIAGEIPSKKIYEDEHIYAFHDINPLAPVHFLVIPKLHIPSMVDLLPEHVQTMGLLNCKVPELAKSQGLQNGFRCIVNTGVVGRQEVYHLHLHVLGGDKPLPGMLPH